jgi:hypothetical protein
MLVCLTVCQQQEQLPEGAAGYEKFFSDES